MEDSVTDTEKLVVLNSKEEEKNVVEEKPTGFINQLISNFAPERKEEDEEMEKKGYVEIEEEKKEEGNEKGFFSHIISNLVSPVSSPRVGDGKASEFFKGGEEDEEMEKKGCVETEEEKKEEGNEKGFFSHIISNLVSPVSSPRVGDGKASEFFKGGEEEMSKKSLEKNGGESGGKEEESKKSPEKSGGDGGGNGGGIIDNIVANLPSPLADDAAPETDEASILIHSIIHD